MKRIQYLKVGAVSAVVAVGITALFAWLRGGDYSALTFAANMFIVAGSGVAARYLFETRKLPAPVLQVIDRCFALGPRDMARGVLNVLASYPALVFGVMAILVWEPSAPDVDTLPSFAAGVWHAVVMIGTIWMLVVAVQLVLVGIINDNDPWQSILSVVERFVMLGLVLLAVRVFGNDLADLAVGVKENPDAALAMLTACVLLGAAFSFAPGRRMVAARGNSGYAVAAGVMGARKERAPADIQRTAVHEAGHLLLYACLLEVPADLSVIVHTEVGAADKYRGFVNHAGEEPTVTTERFAHWAMLRHLAGAEAEFIVFGERADGACGDNSNWMSAATMYLSSGFGEAFFAKPDGEAQIMHNRAVLNSLKARCVAEVDAFVATNKALLEELAAAIVEHKSMTREQLLPYLARVADVETMPRVRYNEKITEQ